MTSGIMVEDHKKLTHVRANTLPENACYRDDGCDVSPSCFSCRLPMCKFDDPGWFQRENRRERDIRIVRDRSEKGFDHVQRQGEELGIGHFVERLMRFGQEAFYERNDQQHVPHDQKRDKTGKNAAPPLGRAMQ